MEVQWDRRFRGMLTEIFNRPAASRGYPVRAVEAAEDRLGVALPAALRGYYLSVGRHPINRAHNRLLAPEALFLAQGRLVFMEENQNVVYWGVQSRTRAADPMVFQTTAPDEEEWIAEARCARFLSAMLCWQAVGGGLPHLGYSDAIDLRTIRRLTRRWYPAGSVGGFTAFVRDGRVVCVMEGGDSVLLHVGTRTRRGYEALTAELGVPLDDL